MVGVGIDEKMPWQYRIPNRISKMSLGGWPCSGKVCTESMVGKIDAAYQDECVTGETAVTLPTS